MTIRRSKSALAFAAVLAATVAAGVATGTATPLAADDPPPADLRSDESGSGIAPASPRPGAVLDAMPVMRLPPSARAQTVEDPGPIDVEATGATGESRTEPGLSDPGLGARPTPREARQGSGLGETIMRPRGGSASGGKPDVPVER